MSQEQQKEKQALEDIKKLLMLLCAKNGATTGEIGAALGVSKGRVSQLIAVKTKKSKIKGAK
ncbi:hypothetical protein K8R43_00605 [archaeon]|nr:hypothetical protein [archaeon]